MAIKGTYAQLLVDEFDFSGDTAGFDVAVSMSEEECTTLGAQAAEYVPILPNLQISHNGYLTGVSNPGTIEAELSTRLGVSGSYVAALLGTHETACPAYVQNTFGAQMNIQAPARSLITLNGSWGVGHGGARGIRIFSGTISATGAQTAVDLGSAGSAGGIAFLFVRSITGSASNAAIAVQSSTTQAGTYSDEGTFTFSAVGAYAVNMSGTVNRWLRLNATSLGGATNLTVVGIACVKGVTY